nr:helix-turn-helix transcriptional regulator [Haloactinospora alba]
MQRPHSPSIRRRRLSSELRKARDQAKLTTNEAAKNLGWAHGKLSKIENAETQSVKSGDLDKMLDLYNVDDAERREAMHQLARQAKERGWWAKYRDVFGKDALPDWETEASMIRRFEGLTIPGLLQTPEYAAAVFRAGRAVPEADIRRQVEARMARHEILNRVRPPHMTAVLDESVLQRVIGSPEVMHEQLTHLKHLALRHHIDVQILPHSAGAHLALAGPFTILDFPQVKDQSIVHVETVANDLFLEHPEELEQYNLAFSNVQGVALSTALSADLIDNLLADLESKR